MKRSAACFICLFLFLASPLSATVIITFEDLGNHTAKLGYDVSQYGLLPRAFSLVLSVSEGVITSVEPCHVGESTSENPGYGIFPGQIIIDDDGDVDGFGTPVAPATDPGATGTGIGYNTVILGLGLLYDGEANAPLDIGDLITFTVSGNCGVMVVEEDTYRGGIVMEDGTSGDIYFGGGNIVPEPMTLLLLGFGGLAIRRKRPSVGNSHE